MVFYPIRCRRINVELNRLFDLGINSSGDVDGFRRTRVQPTVDDARHQQPYQQSNDPGDEERSRSHWP
jgi:hypothetical protein